MGVAYDRVYAADGTLFNVADRPYFGVVAATYAAGGGAGDAVTVAVSWNEPIPTPYAALMCPVEDSTYFITSPTALGFTLNVEPRLAASTLAGGTVKIVLVA